MCSSWYHPRQESVGNRYTFCPCCDEDISAVLYINHLQNGDMVTLTNSESMHMWGQEWGAERVHSETPGIEHILFALSHELPNF